LTNYNSSRTSLTLILALMSACTLNADVHDNNLNTPGNGGSAGSSVVPNPNNGGTGGSGGSVSVGGTASVPDADAGVAGNAGTGGTVSFADAGVAGSDSDGGIINPDPPVRVCDTPKAIGSDYGNWFTTNTVNINLRINWFQLIDENGFIDSCTYVGRIKWYHPEVDQLNQTWYVSDGLWDDPTTIFTINFNTDGSVMDRVDYPSIYPGAGYTVGNCLRAYEDPEWEGYGSISILKPEYELKYCFRNKTNYNWYGVVGLFRGTWDDSFQKPVLPKPVTEWCMDHCE
jgi:hypothetical protein